MSRAADSKIIFGEYLPDVPALDSPGLVRADNVVWLDGAYRRYANVSATIGVTSALAARPRGAISVKSAAGTVYTYAGTATKLYVLNGTGFSSRYAGSFTTGSADFWRFAQFDEFLIATNYADVPQAITIGSGSDFVDLALTGTAPKARIVGVVGRHLVLGDTVDGTNGTVPYRIAWCRIDDPTEWPVPNSADALAKQSGEQFMPSKNGAVTGIIGNDQFGIVIQQTGVSRMTYVGGDLVYQFDEIDGQQGCRFPNSIVQVGNLAYFIANTGLCVTDGVSVKNLSAGRFNTLLASITLSNSERVCGAFDYSRNLLYFAYPTSASGTGRPNKVLIYNIKDDRVTLADDNLETLFQRSSFDGAVTYSQTTPLLYTFDASNIMAGFVGATSTPVIESGEAELNPGLYTRISGVKALTNDSNLSTIALRYRDNLFSTPSATAETAVSTRTGFADFRIESRYVRARLTGSALFDYATGVEFQQTASGAA